MLTSISCSRWTNGLTLGRVLHAEEIPHVLTLGTAWLGSFRDRLFAAYDAKPGATDATEVLRALEAVRREMGTGNPAAVVDGLRRLRRAADGLSAAGGEERHGAFSEGRRIADGLMRPRMLGDFSRPGSIAEINERNRQFHARTNAALALDASGRMDWRRSSVRITDTARQTALRNAVHAQAQAPTPADRLRAMNDAARAFWPSTGITPGGPVGGLGVGIGKTAVDINARNRAFWVGQGS